VKPENKVSGNDCPIVSAIREIGGEWNLIVIRYLMEGDMGFNELKRKVTGVSPRTLSSVLKELASKNIVRRDVVSTQPFSVLYSLTEKGRTLKPIVDDLGKWGTDWTYAGNADHAASP